MNELLRELLMLPEQGSSVAAEIDTLHYVIIGVTTAGAIAVALAVLYFLIRYRDRGQRRSPRRGSGVSRRFEIAAIGGLLALFITWWAVGMRQYLRITAPPDDAVDVYVVAKQWMWSFAYPNGGATQDVLYVPVGQPVRLIMTSRDVIHSFYVPGFRLKQDVIPGRSTTLWFEATRPGRYQVLCAEYCGARHSQMRAAVVALPPGEYRSFLDGLTPELASLAERGRQVAADAGCLRCHTLDGSPHIGPSWAGLYGASIPLASGERIEVDPAFITESIMDPTARVHSGFREVMPSYLGKLEPAEISAVIELIRSLRDVRAEPREERVP